MTFLGLIRTEVAGQTTLKPAGSGEYSVVTKTCLSRTEVTGARAGRNT